MRVDKLKEKYGDRIEIESKSFLLRTAPKTGQHEDFVTYTNSWMRPKETEPDLDYNVWASNDPQPRSSIEAQVAFKVVEELAPDKAKAFHDRIMHAYFSENRDISNTDILTELAVDVDVDATAFNEALELRGEAMTTLVFEDYNGAISKDVTGIPTVLFEHQFPVVGAQPLSVYENIVEQIEKHLEAQDL